MLKKISQLHREALSVIAKNPMIMLLFLFLAVAEALALTTLFLAHSAPFSKIFAPIIRRFWGDRFLHYPDNFLLLPKLYGYANAAILTVVGLLVSGITIKLIEAAVLHTGVSTLTAAQSSFQKYFGLLAVWIPAFLIMRYGTSFLMPHIPHSLPAEFMVILLMFVVIQAITAFLFTAVMTSKNGFFKALVEGFGTLKEQGGVLIGAIFIPCVIGVALSFLKSTAPSFVRFYPESVLLILYSGIFITMVIDLYVTSVSTILYLKARNKV